MTVFLLSESGIAMCRCFHSTLWSAQTVIIIKSCVTGRNSRKIFPKIKFAFLCLPLFAVNALLPPSSKHIAGSSCAVTFHDTGRVVHRASTESKSIAATVPFVRKRWLQVPFIDCQRLCIVHCVRHSVRLLIPLHVFNVLHIQWSGLTSGTHKDVPPTDLLHEMLCFRPNVSQSLRGLWQTELTDHHWRRFH